MHARSRHPFSYLIQLTPYIHPFTSLHHSKTKPQQALLLVISELFMISVDLVYYSLQDR